MTHGSAILVNRKANTVKQRTHSLFRQESRYWAGTGPPSFPVPEAQHQRWSPWTSRRPTASWSRNSRSPTRPGQTDENQHRLIDIRRNATAARMWASTRSYPSPTAACSRLSQTVTTDRSRRPARRHSSSNAACRKHLRHPGGEGIHLELPQASFHLRKRRLGAGTIQARHHAAGHRCQERSAAACRVRARARWPSPSRLPSPCPSSRSHNASGV